MSRIVQATRNGTGRVLGELLAGPVRKPRLCRWLASHSDVMIYVSMPRPPTRRLGRST